MSANYHQCLLDGSLSPYRLSSSWPTLPLILKFTPLKTVSLSPCGVFWFSALIASSRVVRRLSQIAVFDFFQEEDCRLVHYAGSFHQFCQARIRDYRFRFVQVLALEDND